eukprot:s256_g26.t1
MLQPRAGDNSCTVYSLQSLWGSQGVRKLCSELEWSVYTVLVSFKAQQHCGERSLRVTDPDAPLKDFVPAAFPRGCCFQMADKADLPQFLPQVLPMLEWVEIRRVCLTQQQCSRSLVQAVHQRYLGEAPSSVRARVQRLGDRLNGAQAAQARGSPEALASAAVEVMVLQQCTRVLSENCEKYADLLERVGFTLGDDLEKVSDALLASLDRLQAFAAAVARLQAAAEAAPRLGTACRAAGYPSDD